LLTSAVQPWSFQAGSAGASVAKHQVVLPLPSVQLKMGPQTLSWLGNSLHLGLALGRDANRDGDAH
jgi:hypothetical protein